MLSGINLINFKAFQELYIDAKPITILCGTNSCGKSSIVQSILLAKQTFENNNVGKTISLNGKYVRLDTFNNIIFEQDSDKPVALGYQFEVAVDQLKNLVGSLDAFWETIIQTRYLKSIGVDVSSSRLIIDVAWVLMKGFKPGKGGRTVRRGVRPQPPILNPKDPDLIDVEKFTFNVTIEAADGCKIDGFQLHILKDEEAETGNCLLEWSNLSLGSSNKNIKKKNIWNFPENFSVACYPVFENLIPFIPSELINWDDGSNEDVQLAQRFLNLLNIRQLLHVLFKTCTYIGPLREQPLRRYIYEVSDEIHDIGSKGENAVYFFLDQAERYIDYYAYENRPRGANYDPETGQTEIEGIKPGFYQKKNLFADAVKTWLNSFGIEGLQLASDNDVHQLTVGEYFKVNIADAGFGISQVFPIIVEGLKMFEGGTLILEQPEIHLHPKIQAQLADFFISLALSGKNTIIETHSEHLINRLVRRIIEDNTDKLKDLVGIFFITPTDEGSEVEEIIIDDVRGITRWPKDFFDQAAEDIREKLKASVEKRKVIFLRKDDKHE